jgi:hypothetical protein
MMRGIGLAFLFVGGAIVVVALAWWWTTYVEVVKYDYLSWREALNCLVWHSDVCSLATALCLGSHPRVLINYWSSAFWIGLTALSTSLFLTGRASMARQR